MTEIWKIKKQGKENKQRKLKRKTCSEEGNKRNREERKAKKVGGEEKKINQ